MQIFLVTLVQCDKKNLKKFNLAELILFVKGTTAPFRWLVNFDMGEVLSAASIITAVSGEDVLNGGRTGFDMEFLQKSC